MRYIFQVEVGFGRLSQKEKIKVHYDDMETNDLVVFSLRFAELSSLVQNRGKKGDIIYSV